MTLHKERAHRGVIANLRSSPAESSDSDKPARAFQLPGENATYYMKFSNDTDTTLTPNDETAESVETELYKLKTEGLRTTPSKLEFRLYKKTRPARPKQKRRPAKKQKSGSSQKELISVESLKTEAKQKGIWARLQGVFSRMKKRSKTQPACETTSDSSASPRRDRIDVYYFDHGSVEYFRTTDCPPAILSELLARQTTQYATRFWAEIFGSLHIGVAFFVAFFLQTYRFLLFSLVRTFLVGFLQMSADYCVKPLLTVLFNGFLQPFITLLLNVLESVRAMLEPIALVLESFVKPVTELVKAFRLVVVTNRQVVGAESREAVAV